MVTCWMLADAINMVIAELIYVIIQDMSWPFHFLIFSVFESASGSSKVWIKNKTSRWNFMDSTVQTELLKNLITKSINGIRFHWRSKLRNISIWKVLFMFNNLSVVTKLAWKKPLCSMLLISNNEGITLLYGSLTRLITKSSTFVCQ